MSKRDRKKKRTKARKKLRWLVRCDGCGLIQVNTKAHPPPEFPMRPKPLLSPSRFEAVDDFAAACRRCPSVTGAFVRAAGGVR